MSDLIERAKAFHSANAFDWQTGYKTDEKLMADFAQFEALRIADDLEALAMNADDLATALVEFVDGLRGNRKAGQA